MWRLLIVLTAGTLFWSSIASSAGTDRTGAPKVYQFNPKLAVEYGNLINLAYTMAGRATPPREYTPPYDGLPPQYNFVAWVRMNDFTPSGRIRPKFYGIIVQRKSDPNSFILALRGTDSGIEWWDDLTAVFPITMPQFPGTIGEGFGRIFASTEVIGLDGQPTDEFGRGFVREVAAAVARRMMRRSTRLESRDQALTLNRINIEVTGHSLGAALATLYVMANANDVQLRISRVYTFASPLVGNYTFANAYDSLGIETWRIANFSDWVPYLPPDLSYRHVKEGEQVSSWFEVHADPGCWHSLLTYLHVLDSSIDIRPDCISLQPEPHYVVGH